MNARTFIAALFFGCALIFSLGARAQAHTTSIYHGGTYYGSVVVEPGQVVYGDLNVLLGNATIDGVVDGNVDVIGGSAYLAPGATITGHVNALGGEVQQDVLPWNPDDDVASSDSDAASIYWKLGIDAVVFLMFLIFPLRARMALGRLETQSGLSAIAGAIGWTAMLTLPIMLFVALVVAQAAALVLVPLVALGAIALIFCCLIGKAALALLVGRRLSELLHAHSTPHPLMALALGLVLITAAELMPVVGVLVSILVGLLGFGCVLLTFFHEHILAIGPGSPEPRPPMSGPPMTVA